MATITISRQLGSLGLDVARVLADQLRYRLVHRELINQAALRAGAPEMALATIDELGLLDLCPSQKDCEAYHQAVHQVMLELVAEGNVVIVGRAGQAILRGHPEVLHVRIIAPQKLRAERIAKLHKIPVRKALAQIEASDRYRKNYLQQFYKMDWDDPEQYDLVLNTARLVPIRAATLVESALSSIVQPNHMHN